MRTTLILGAGGHGQVVADALLASGRANLGGTGEPLSLAFVDDDPALLGERFLGVEVIGDSTSLASRPTDPVVVAIGDNRERARMYRALQESGRDLPSVVHPSAVVAATACLGSGVVVCAGVVVGLESVVRDGAILNTSCSIDHHCDIGAFTHVAPGAHLGGNVTVGEHTLVGLGASVIPGVRIGASAVVAAGAVVIRDVDDGMTVLGTPALPKGTHS